MTERPWGSFKNLDAGLGWYLKTLRIRPHSKLSLQYHEHRSELWMLAEGEASAVIRHGSGLYEWVKLNPGEVFRVGRGAVHRLRTDGWPAVVVELSFGDFREDDIIRIEDDYGRAP